ncbi:MAG: ribosome silencing factor [Chloroflexia bacterium]|nr:ribosome silencing factor [Chloroflexia bacterium]
MLQERPIETNERVDQSPNGGPANLLGRDLALAIAETISDTPASNTLVLDIHEASAFADYFVICSGENERQLRAIHRGVADDLARRGIRPQRTEGVAISGWILLDFGDVIVHIFADEQRSFYRLEDLWAEAHTLLAIQ